MTETTARQDAEEVLLKAGALQRAILNSANFSSIATDAKGVIQIFNVGAERMLGYAAAEVMNKITPADISDPQEVIARAQALSVELGTPIKPGFEALVFKASRGIEDIYELTYIRKDGSRFPAVVSVTALRDAQDAIIGYLLIGTDNTARKEAEEALLQAGAELTAIQTAVSDAAIVAITDATGKIEQVNDNFVRISKYSREELIGQDHRLLNSGLHPKEFMGDLWVTIASGKVWRNEIRNRAKDGTLYWVDTSITAIRNKCDKVIKYMAVRFDVTARKEAEEALLQAGALQGAIFNSANFSSIATDAKGVIQIFNVGAERMLGYTAAEVINKITPADISDPQEVITRAEALSVELGTPITPGFEALAFKASRGIEDIYELTYICKDASRIPAMVSVTALRDAQDSIIGYLLIGTDNTARKLADDKLRTASQYARSLIEASLDPLVTISPEGKITDVNAGSVKVTGVPREKLIGTDFSNYFTEPEKAREGYQQVFAQGFVTDYPLTIRHEDGRLTDVLYNASVYKDVQGEVLGVFAAARDITARKLVEAEQKKLDQLLRNQTALLSEANEEIQRFVYIVSHDLRSPLVNIMGFASEIDTWRKQMFERLTALRARLGDTPDDKNDAALRDDIEEALAFIKSSVAKMDRLIGALLKLSREGQREFVPQSIDMSQLLQSTLEALTHQARDVSAKVNIADLPAITSDRLALEQVFSNLMDNAVKYLRADVLGNIDVRATESDGAITYEVRDNGRGIDARDRERIFDLFRRSGIQDRPGDGIGLAHARTLVRRLGGSINVESEPDCGTVFKVTLPKKWHQPINEIKT